MRATLSGFSAAMFFGLRTGVLDVLEPVPFCRPICSYDRRLVLHRPLPPAYARRNAVVMLRFAQQRDKAVPSNLIAGDAQMSSNVGRRLDLGRVVSLTWCCVRRPASVSVGTRALHRRGVRDLPSPAGIVPGGPCGALWW